MKAGTFLLILIAAIALLPGFVIAESPRGTIACPRVLVKKGETGVQEGASYRCFKNVREATSRGFSIPSRTKGDGLTGWWRLNLNIARTTCADVEKDQGRTTLFLQLRESSDGLFADTCPGGERYVGKRGSDGRSFTLSTQQELHYDPACGGDNSLLTILFDFNDVVGREVSQVRYSLIRSCLGAQTGMQRCSTTWKGNGGRERPDHRFWPEVSENVSDFNAACTTALTKCSGCHG